MNFYLGLMLICYLSILCDRCLPMNLRTEDLSSGVLRDRVKVGASLADVDPMNLDTSVSLGVLYSCTFNLLSSP